MQATGSGKKAGRARSKTQARAFVRSSCAVASTLDLVGDKWSLLVVRDLISGSATYKELQESPERIPTNILADRLKKLEQRGLITKTAYQQHPVRHAYSLTEKGKDLGEVLLALVRWGMKHIPGTEALRSPTLNPAASGRELTRKKDRSS
jgi:DNA-binding HxlR family transcriptional regulator